MQFVRAFNLFGVKTKQIPNDTGKGAPTTATKGAVGCQYMDTDTGKVYKCTSAIDGVYIWEPLGGGAGSADISYFGTPYSSAVPKDGIDVFKKDGKSTVKLFLFETDNGYDAVVRGSGAIRDYTEATRLPEVEKITRLHIEAGVTSIGNYFMYKAFNLKKLTFENSDNILHLGYYAFAYSQIDGEYEFPNLEDSTLNKPFMACPKLVGLEFNSAVKNISEKAFQFCVSLQYVKGLSGVVETDENIRDETPSIGDAAFQYCTSLQSLDVVPENVTLGKWVFILTPTYAVIDGDETTLSDADWKDKGTLCFMRNEWADQFAEMKAVAETAPDIPRIPVPESDNQKNDFYKNEFRAFWAVLNPADYPQRPVEELTYKTSASQQCGFFGLFHIYNTLHPSAQYDNYSDFLAREVFSKKIKLTADVANNLASSEIFGQLTEKTGLTYAEGTEVSADDLPLALDYAGLSYGDDGTAYWGVCQVLGWGYEDTDFTNNSGAEVKQKLLNSLAEGKPVYMSIIGASDTARHGVVAIGYDKETDKLLIIDSTWEYDSDIVKLAYWCEFESIINPAEAAYIRIFDFPEDAKLNEIKEKLDMLVQGASFRIEIGSVSIPETLPATGERTTSYTLKIPNVSDHRKIKAIELYADEETIMAIKELDYTQIENQISYLGSVYGINFGIGPGAILTFGKDENGKTVPVYGVKGVANNMQAVNLYGVAWDLSAKESSVTFAEDGVTFAVYAIKAGNYKWVAYYWD